MPHPKNYGWPTSRTFPRTIPEAFKDDPANAQWFYPPERKRGYLNAVVLILGLMMWAAIGFYFWKA